MESYIPYISHLKTINIKIGTVKPAKTKSQYTRAGNIFLLRKKYISFHYLACRNLKEEI